MSQPLSPAAQGVFDRVVGADTGEDYGLDVFYRAVGGAALRAAVEQIRASDKGELSDTIEDVLRGAEREHICGFLSAIATELEAAG